MLFPSLFVTFIAFATAMALLSRSSMPSKQNATGLRLEENPDRSPYDLGRVIYNWLRKCRVAIKATLRTIRRVVSPWHHEAVLRARQAKVRLLLRRARAMAHRAQEAVIDQRLAEAESFLDQAHAMLERAHRELDDDQHGNLLVGYVRRSCHYTAITIRAHAAHTLGKMDRALGLGSDGQVLRFRPAFASDNSRRAA